MINVSAGKTGTEKLLTSLCEKSFLNLWCYPNPYFKKNSELCDLLVICDKHIIIFSDKNIAFSNKLGLEIAWERWFDKAILKSIKQLKRAENWLKKHPDKIYLDPKCQEKQPIPDPVKDNFRIHLVAIANGASQYCQDYFKGNSTGSLIFSNLTSDKRNLFTINDENPFGTFVHIFNEFSLPILIQELDTITDFIAYLQEKENFLRSGKFLRYFGEENLLAYYLKNYDINQEKHTFRNLKSSEVFDSAGIILITEGQWDNVKNHPQYLLKKDADYISYLWDALISQFTNHMLAGTSNSHGRSLKEHEGGVRYMALEPRFYRRMLSRVLLDVSRSYSISTGRCIPKITTLPISNQYGLVYLFIQFPYHSTYFSSYEDYMQKRQNYLYMCCMAARAVLPDIMQIPITKVLGIATEPPLLVVNAVKSEDMVLLMCEEWSIQQQNEGEFFREKLDIFSSERMREGRMTEKNFPEV